MQITSALGAFYCQNVITICYESQHPAQGHRGGHGWHTVISPAFCKKFHAQRKGVQNVAKSTVESLFPSRFLQLTSDAWLAALHQTPSFYWRRHMIFRDECQHALYISSKQIKKRQVPSRIRA